MRKSTRIQAPAGSNPEDRGEHGQAIASIHPSERTVAYERQVLTSLRKIVRAIDLYSRELKALCGLTVPQLVCLSSIVRGQRTTGAELALQVHLSPSTMVGILDRLERAGHVRRERNSRDRREVFITATESGREAVRRAPSPLQDNLAHGLAQLPSPELARIARSLEKIVELMEAQEIQVAPLLTLERKSYAAAPVVRVGTRGRLPGRAKSG